MIQYPTVLKLRLLTLALGCLAAPVATEAQSLPANEAEADEARWIPSDPQPPLLGSALRLDEIDLPESPRTPALPSRKRAINNSNRAAMADFYRTEYLPAFDRRAGWTGDVGQCLAGDTAPAYETASLQLIHYFRAMVGLENTINLDDTLNAKCREAALMMIAEGSLSHSPGSGWACHSEAGADAAGHSNIALGTSGPASVAAYMADTGTNNTAVGHRRWILYPPQRTMGSGSTDARNGFYHGSNSLWVIGDFGPRPPDPEWIAWPPPGFVPYPVVYRRWSFSRPGANFSNAAIVMRLDGAHITLDKLAVKNGYGDNTVVWEPDIQLGRPAEDLVYTIDIQNVVINQQSQSFQYQVIVFDPNTVVQNAATDWRHFD